MEGGLDQLVPPELRVRSWLLQELGRLPSRLKGVRAMEARTLGHHGETIVRPIVQTKTLDKER